MVKLDAPTTQALHPQRNPQLPVHFINYVLNTFNSEIPVQLRNCSSQGRGNEKRCKLHSSLT